MTRQLIIYATLFAFTTPVLTQTASAQSAPAAVPQAEPASRGLFLLALIPVLAGMVGRTGDHLIDGYFQPRPATPPKPAAVPKPEEKPAAAAAKPTVKPEQLSLNGNYYAGVAYATYVIGPNKEAKKVDPATYQFQTGDQFFVRYVPNLPGRVSVSNINPSGKEVQLGSWAVVAGQEVTLPAQGNFEFSGATGDEGLHISFSPCTNGAAGRDITVTAVADVNYGTLLPACGNGPSVATREIPVNYDNGVGYAVSPLDKGEIQSRAVETRALLVRFRHTGAQAMQSEWLVSPDEAAQAVSRAVAVPKNDPDGPAIVVRQPGVVKEVKAPVTIDVAFEPKAGRIIDFNKIKVTYLKLFDIDITDRMKPYFTPTGLHSDNAKLPPGEHNIELEVTDDAGRKTTERFSFKVLK